MTLPGFTFYMDLKLTESCDKAVSRFLKSMEIKPDQLYRTKQGSNHTTRIAIWETGRKETPKSLLALRKIFNKL